MGAQLDLRRLADARLAQLRAQVADPLFSGAFNLMASTVLTGLLGIGFWAAAARLYPTAEVGRDAILISALITVSSICQLNLVDAVVRFLPGVPAIQRRRRIAAAYGASSVAALGGGIAFVTLAPNASRQLSFLSDDFGLAAAFVGSVVIWGVFVIQDAVLTSLRRALWLPFENSGFSLAKIVILPLALAAGFGHGVFLAWIAPSAVIVLVVNYLLFKRILGPAARTGEITPASTAPPRGRLARFLAQDYLGYVLAQSSSLLLPIIVLSHLGSRANAYFAIPFTLILTFDLLFYSATVSLTVEAAHDASRTAELARTVIRRFLSVQVPAAAVIALTAPWLLIPFGSEYVHHGASTLRLLACASGFRALLYMFVALARLRVSGKPIILAQASLSAIAVSLGIVLVDPLGGPGVALGWLIANAAVALATAPSLYRLLHVPTVAAETSG